MMEKRRTLIFYKEYFHAFFDQLPERGQRKIDEVLYAVMVLDRIPRRLFSHMTGHEGLYEIRVLNSGNIYRIFCCFDEGNLVILFNGFVKKSQKTPKREIEKALKLRAEYFEEKKGKRHENK